MSRNYVVEQKLKVLGIKYEYIKEFLIGRIEELSTSSVSNVRLDEGIVETNAAAMQSSVEQGVGLPAPIIYRNGSVCEIVDGNHRIYVLRKVGHKSCDVYLLDSKNVSEAAKKMLQRIVNNWTGADTKRNAAALAALAVKESGGKMKLTEAAKDAGVHSSTVQTHMRVMEARVKLLAAGHNFSKKPLSEKAIEVLNPIVNRTAAVMAAAAIASDANMSSQEIRPMANEFKNAADDKEVSEIAHKYRVLYPHRRKAKRPGGNINRLLRSLSMMQNLLAGKDFFKKIGRELNDIEKMEVVKKIQEVKLGLNELAKRI